LPTFFCDISGFGRLTLDETESHHLIHVLRLRLGDAVQVMDGRGTVGEGIVANISRKCAVIDVQNVLQIAPRQTGRIALAVSIPKGPHLDALITRCTELAADHIALTLFERTVKQPAGRSFAERCRKISIAAAKQCGRPFLPVITGPEGLSTTLAGLVWQYPGSTVLFGRCDTAARPMAALGLDPKVDKIALIGPEGGLTADEERLLEEHGAAGVRLNENILRVETAAMAFCAVCAAGR